MKLDHNVVLALMRWAKHVANPLQPDKQPVTLEIGLSSDEQFILCESYATNNRKLVASSIIGYTQ